MCEAEKLQDVGLALALKHLIGYTGKRLDGWR